MNFCFVIQGAKRKCGVGVDVVDGMELRSVELEV